MIRGAECRAPKAVLIRTAALTAKSSILNRLYYYGGRYYDAEIGRFISPDPFVPQPGNPQSLNRYSYTLNNPQNYIDPSGYFFDKLLRRSEKLSKVYGSLPSEDGKESLIALPAGLFLEWLLPLPPLECLDQLNWD
jgi:RHS repeat-associated protein